MGDLNEQAQQYPRAGWPLAKQGSVLYEQVWMWVQVAISESTLSALG